MLTFVARQAVKLVEESCEFFLVFEWRHPALMHLSSLIVVVKNECKVIFDDDTLWKPEPPFHIDTDLDALLSEAADIMVVLACATEGLGVLDQKTYNVVQMAVIKATADIERGKRAG